MTVLPFVCLGIGIALGVIIKANLFLKIADIISTIALFFLMLTIGLGIGLDEKVMNNLTKIGFNCAIISLFGIGFSVFFTYVCEKTVVPLKQIDLELGKKHLDLYSTEAEFEEKGEATREEKKAVSLVWIMPLSLIAGLLLGIFTRSWLSPSLVNTTFVFFLATLYICVGIAQGSNLEVFKYVKLLGFRILWISAAILAGSLVGGLVSGIILGLPLYTSMVASGGMSFYSITGAFMTSTYGIEIGTYGFIVNVMREIFTILLMPLLIKISLGSPIAGGAAGNMDTMLAPVTKFVGVRLGLVTLITGTILTFIVPFLLPILAGITG